MEKTFTRFVFPALLALIFVFHGMDAKSQCALGSFYYGDLNEPPCSFSSINDIGSGEYVRFDVVDGVKYRFSTCGTSFDTQLTGYQGTTTQVFYNDDNGPDCSGLQASVDWTSSFTGFLRVRLDKFNCQGYAGTTSAILKYREMPGDTPGTPVISSGSTAPCPGTTVTLARPSSPPTGYTWYWQTSSTGTSTSIGSGSTLTVNSSGTYYLRARSNSVHHCWSATSSGLTINYKTNSSAPTSINASSTTICSGSSVTLTRSGGSLGTGADWEWYSGSCGGVSVGSGNSISVSPTSTTTYYVRAEGDCNTTGCASVTITVNSSSSNPSGISATANPICPGNSTILSVSGGSLGSGATWNWYSGSCGGTFVGTGSSVTVSPSSNTTYYVRAEGTCNTTSCASLTINVNSNSSISSASASPNPICDGQTSTLSVSGSLGTGASWQWYTGSCGGTSVGSGSSIGVTPSSTTTYYVRAEGTCNNTSCQTVTVTVTQDVGTPSDPAGPTSRCQGAGSSNYSSTASNASSYSWSLTPGTAGSINGSGQVTWNSSFFGTATVEVTAEGCGPDQSATTDVEVYQNPTIDAGSGGNECDLTFTFNASTNVGTGTWSQQSGPGTSSYSNANSPSATATATQYGTYIYRWTVQNGDCSEFDEVTVSYYEQPVADAGSGGSVCGDEFTFSASPSAGTGTWSKTFGPGTATFDNVNDPTTTVTVSAPGSYQFKWEEVNGPCSDAETITVDFTEQPVANAGSGGDECDLNFSFNAVASAGTGTWTQQSGPGTTTFNNANSPTATGTVSMYGTYVYRWTENNSGCTDFDEITVNYYQQPVSDAGSGGSECDLDFDLSATPSVGSGVWTQQAGPGSSVFNNANSPSTTVTADNYGTYTYRWTETNGSCTDFDQVIVNFYEQPVADAGQGDTVCGLSFTYGATASVGTGTWTLAGGAGIVTNYNPNNHDPNATVTVSNYGTYFFIWTEENGICDDDDTIQVLFNEPPTAHMSGDTAICVDGYATISVELEGSAPWEITYTDGTPVTVTGINSSPYTFLDSTENTWSMVEVVDMFGCVGTISGSAEIDTNSLPPVPTITNQSGLNGFCEGQFTILSASTDPSYESYEWSPGGETAQNIAADVAGDYVVTVTDANDCQSSSDSLEIVVFDNPTPVIVSDTATTICNGDTVNLSTSQTYDSYDWSPNGETTDTIAVTTSGNYSVTVEDSNGCEGTSSTTQVTVHPNPSPTVNVFGGSANGATEFCQGQNVNLLAVGGSNPTYEWSPGGQTTQVINVNASGEYYVEVTNETGCSGFSDTVEITVNPIPTPTVSSSGATTFCAGGSVDLSVDQTYSAYEWSNGATTQTITATQSGNYTVTVTDANGCEATSAATTVTVNPNPTPTISADGPLEFCDGEDVTLSVGSYSTYSWSNGATTQSITVSSSGTFDVTVTDANGCTGTSATVTVTVNPNPTPTISADGPTTFCQGENVVLTSSESSGNVWSTGVVSQSITVTQSGDYSVTVTDPNGCTATSAITTVTVNPNPVVTISPDGPTTFCNGGDVTLTANSSTTAASYAWSNGATTQDITVSSSGTFTVTVTDVNGCEGTSSPVTVTVNNNPSPSITPNGPTEFCDGGNVQLWAPSAADYSWSNGATTQFITVNSSGSFTVTVTNGNGCSGTSAPETVTVNPLPSPTVTPDGPTAFCDGGDVTLSVDQTYSAYSWSNGATTQSITVSTSGSYSVTVTDANGCSATSAATPVTVYSNPTPTISADGPLEFCDGEDVVLSVGSYSSYAWSNGATTQSITVDASGTFDVTVTDANGCVGTSSTVTVTVNPNPTPTIAADGPTEFCEGEDVVLTSSESSGNVWSTGVVSQSITVDESGEYWVTVTDANGCTTRSDTTEVIVNPNPTPVISSTAPNGCAGDTILLYTNYAGSGTVSHVWSPGGATTDTLEVTSSGTFNVTVTDANGCTATSNNFNVTIGEPPQPVITPLGPTEFCDGEEVILFSSSSTDNLWSTGETTQFITVDETSEIWLEVTYTGGCTERSDTLDVIVNPNPTPAINAGGPTAFCDGGDVTLFTTQTYSSYLWSNGATTQSINVDESGSYSVTVTDANGCTATSSATTITVYPNPDPVITADGPLEFCDGEDVVLSVGSYATYSWSNGATTQSITVDASGSFDVTVTDANGCTTTSASVTVTVNPNPTPVITPNGPIEFCDGGEVILESSESSGNVWSTGVVSQSITVEESGEFWVTVTDANGCTTTSDTTEVTVHPNPVVTISADGPLAFCAGSNVTLTANSSTTAASYLWSNGATTQSVTTDTSGTYSVTVTDVNGCSGSSSSVTTSANSNPTASILPLGATEFCEGDDVDLLASGNLITSYSWSPNGETTQVITVDQSGEYYATVTDINGCTGNTDTVEVTVNPLPAVSFTGLDAEYCVDDPSATLTGTPVGGFFTGPVVGNTFNPSAAGVGNYVVTYNYTDGNGCSNSESQNVEVHPLPVVSFSGLGSEYCVDDAAVTLTGTPTGGTFSGPGISGNTFNPADAGDGTHDITYTYTDGNGCVNSETQSVIVHPLPVLAINGIVSEYCVDADPVNMQGSPAGGSFSGPGVSAGVFYPGTAGVGTHTITYAYTDGNGCFNSVDSIITIHPLPVVSILNLEATYCIDDDVDTILGDPVGGTFSGNGMSGNIFDPAGAGVGTHAITYTYTDGNGCTNSVTQQTEVIPLPNVSFSGLDPEYCVDDNPATLLGSPSGGVFSGPGVSGTTFDPSVAGEGNFTITYVYTDQYGCVNSTTQDVTVHPLPVISFSGLAANYCIGDPSSNLTGNPSGGSFSGPGISGGGFHPNAAGIGTHTITFTYTDNNGCSNSLTQTVNVHGLPTASFSGLQSLYCVDAGSETLTGTPGGGVFTGPGVSGNTFDPGLAGVGNHTITYTYTDVNGCSDSESQTVDVVPLPNVTFSGLGNQYCQDASPVTLTGNPSGGNFSGPGITGNTFNPAQAGVGTHTIFYSAVDANGCSNSDIQNVTVVALPVVSFSGLGADYCIDDGNALLQGNPVGGTFSGPGINGNFFVPVQAGVGTHSITYTYTDGNTCTGSDDQNVTVHALPTLSITGLDTEYCTNSGPDTAMGVPSGGSFSGPGMSGNIFRPQIAGPGLHTITYTYTDGNGCTNNTTFQVTVYAEPSVSFTGLGASYCISDDVPVQLVGTPSGGTFTGSGISGNQFTPADAGLGTHFITYTYTNTNGCTSTSNQSVEVNDIPTVSFAGLLPDYCVDNDNPVALIGQPQGGTFSGPGITGNAFIPSDAGAGTHDITYTYTNNDGCTDSTTQSVEINELPVVDFSGLEEIYCLEGSPVALTGDPLGGTFSGPGISGNMFNPTTAGIGTHTITYTYEDGNGCENSISYSTEVYELQAPAITANGPTTFCEGETVTLSAGFGYETYLWSNSETTATIEVDQSNSYNVTVTDTNGCEATSGLVTVTVNANPTVELGPDTFKCPEESLVLQATSGFDAYLWSTGHTTPNNTIFTEGDYSVTVTDNNGCQDSDTINVTDYEPVVPVIETNVPPTICNGDTVILDAGDPFQSYEWSDNVSFSQTIAVSDPGIFSVTTLDTNGCEATSDPVTVNVLPLPNAVIVADGPLDLCQGEDVTLSLQQGYAQYNWSNNATTPSITVSTAGTYYAEVTNNQGCSNTTASLIVEVYPQPQPVVIPLTPVEVCAGDSVVLSGGNGFESYTWNNDSTGQILTVYESGAYSVSVIDTNGCGDGIFSPPLNVTVHDPINPFIEVYGDSLSASVSGADYQWYFNGNEITGSTNQWHIADSSGNYMVEVTDENNCTEFSNIIELSVSGVGDELSAINTLELYPNPGRGKFTLVAEFNERMETELIITNILGETIMRLDDIGTVNRIFREISLENKADGIYFVKVATQEGATVIRYVKQ